MKKAAISAIFSVFMFGCGSNTLKTAADVITDLQGCNIGCELQTQIDVLVCKEACDALITGLQKTTEE